MITQLIIIDSFFFCVLTSQTDFFPNENLSNNTAYENDTDYLIDYEQNQSITLINKQIKRNFTSKKIKQNIFFSLSIHDYIFVLFILTMFFIFSFLIIKALLKNTNLYSNLQNFFLKIANLIKQNNR